jgi:hypothetical protein
LNGVGQAPLGALKAVHDEDVVNESVVICIDVLLFFVVVFFVWIWRLSYSSSSSSSCSSVSHVFGGFVVCGLCVVFIVDALGVGEGHALHEARKVAEVVWQTKKGTCASAHRKGQHVLNGVGQALAEKGVQLVGVGAGLIFDRAIGRRL